MKFFDLIRSLFRKKKEPVYDSFEQEKIDSIAPRKVVPKVAPKAFPDNGKCLCGYSRWKTKRKGEEWECRICGRIKTN